jgi:hypothetical protein
MPLYAIKYSVSVTLKTKPQTLDKSFSYKCNWPKMQVGKVGVGQTLKKSLTTLELGVKG